MTISFRTRLFVTAGLIVAVVITAVMLIGWSRVLSFELQRLDDRLCMEAKRLATQPFPAQEVARIENDILGKLSLDAPGQLMLRVQSSIDHIGNANFQSAGWRDEVALDGLQWTAAINSAAITLPNGPLGGPPPQRDGDPNRAPEDSGRPDRDISEQASPGACELATSSTAGRKWRVARFTVAFGRGTLAADLVATQANLQSALKQALQMVVPLAIVFTALGAWLLSALTMRPVNRLRNAMKDVTPKALDQRLPSKGEDREFKVLIDAYNTMLARLQASFQQANRFSADAAHELKTPLTILQGRIEQALGKSDQPAIQADLTNLLDEVGRLSAITRKLLLLSQADAGYMALQRTPINLTNLLDELASDAQMLLTDQHLECAVERNLSVQADAVLLRQLLNNLMSNAVRYCLPGGWIKLRANKLAAGVEIIFSNATPVILPQQRTQFFDRFYRGDAAHNRRVDGNGLGLSLAREIARAHGGELTLSTSAPTEVVFRLVL